MGVLEYNDKHQHEADTHHAHHNAPRHHNQERKWDARKIAIAAFFCLVIVYALYYSFSHLEGISEYGDDPTYTGLASALVHGMFRMNPGYIFSVRLTEVFAIGFFYEIFGISNLTSALWNVASFIGLIIVAFYIVRYFYDDKAALISAFLVTIWPLVTKYTVTIGEDVPLAFVFSLAVLLFLYGERLHQKKYYFFSGFMLVVAWLTSYEAALGIVFLLIYASIQLIRKKITINRTTLYFLYGIAFLFIIVFIYSYINCGHPFITITANTNFYSEVAGTVNGYATIPSANTDLNFYIQSMFQYNMVSTFTHNSIPNAILGLSGELFGHILTYEYGLYFYLLIPVVIGLLLLRDKRSYFLMFWLAFLWCGLEFGPMHVGLTFSPFGIVYLLAHRLTRLMLIATVPLCGVLGIGLAKLLEPKNKILLCIGILMFVFIMIILFLNNYAISNFWYYWQHYPAELTMQATNYIKSLKNPDYPIYLEAFYNNANIGYTEGPIGTYLGNPSAYLVNYSIGDNVSCTSLRNNTYIIWAGPPHCGNWENVYNITTPTDIPSYIISSENPSLGYRITNVYKIE